MSDKKDLIRSAAITLFAGCGYHRTTTDRIAERAGVAVGTIYNYFTDKQDILDHIFLTEHAKRQQMYEETVGQELPSLQKLRAIIGGHFSEVKNNPELVAVILREGHNVGPRVRKKEGLGRILSDIIAQGVRDGTIRRVDPDMCATLIFGAVRAVMREFSAAREDGVPDPELFDRALAQLMDILHDGLPTKPG